MFGTVHIATGFKSDCTKLLQRFETCGSVRFDSFAKCWRHFSFSHVFSGFELFHLLMEFCEEALVTAKTLFFEDDISSHRQIGALFLIYGLYTKQPAKGLAKIRVTEKEWTAMVTFTKLLREENHLDAGYILQKLFFERAFHFVAVAREHGLEQEQRFIFMNQYDTDSEEEDETVSAVAEILPERRQPQVNLNRNEITDDDNAAEEFQLPKIIGEDLCLKLETLHHHYFFMKCALNTGQNACEPEPSLNVLKNDACTVLREIVDKGRGTLQEISKASNTLRLKPDADLGEALVHLQRDSEDSEEEQQDHEYIGTHRRQLKTKAISYRQKAKRIAMDANSASVSKEISYTDPLPDSNDILVQDADYSPPRKRKRNLHSYHTKQKRAVLPESAVTQEQVATAVPETVPYVIVEYVPDEAMVVYVDTPDDGNNT